MLTSKPAPTDQPILEVIKNRWSGLAFADQPVEKEKMTIILEAARWSASSFNEQPWQFVIGYKGDALHQKLADCLVEGNSWAKVAPVLILSIAKTFFAHGHKPNRHYMHDTGMATTHLFLQAADLGLMTHGMAGFDVNKARQYFKIDDDYEPGAMIALGYHGKTEDLPDPAWQERERAPRIRKEKEELIWPTT